jgi:hypothetical protein
MNRNLTNTEAKLLRYFAWRWHAATKRGSTFLPSFGTLCDGEQLADGLTSFRCRGIRIKHFENLRAAGLVDCRSGIWFATPAGLAAV